MKLKGNLILLLVALIWGVAFTAQRAGMDHIGPFFFNGVRFALGCLSLAPLLYFARGEAGKSVGFIQKDAWKAGLVTGTIMFIDLSFQQVGLVYTTAGKAAFITCLYIILVPVGGIFLRQCIPSDTWLGGMLSIGGLYLLCVKDGFTMEYGDLIILGSAIFGAIHILAIGYYAKNVNSLQLAFCQFFICSIASSLMGFAFETFRWQNIYDAAIPILYGGFLSVGVAYTLQIYGQKYAESSHAVIIMSLESAFGALAGYFLLGEILAIGQVGGCVLMLAGVLVSQLGGLRAAKRKLRSRLKYGNEA